MTRFLSISTVALMTALTLASVHALAAPPQQAGGAQNQTRAAGAQA